MKHEKFCLIVSGTTTKANGFVRFARWFFKSLEDLFLALDTHTGGKGSHGKLTGPVAAFTGVWEACHQQAKKERSSLPWRFFWRTLVPVSILASRK